MNKNEGESKRKFGVLDFFIILVIILCVGGICLRLFMKSNADKDNGFDDIQPENYTVAYVSKNQRSFVPGYLTEDAEFRLEDSGDLFGKHMGKPLVQPAEVDVTDPDGTHRLIYNTSTDERTDRNDLRGSFLVRGKLNDSGLLLLDGSETVIALNKEYTVESDLLVFDFIVTGISKAS